jgi:hypothetical protein
MDGGVRMTCFNHVYHSVTNLVLAPKSNFHFQNTKFKIDNDNNLQIIQLTQPGR